MITKNSFLKHWHTQKYVFKADTSNDNHKIHLGKLASLLLVYSSGILLLFFIALILTAIGFFFKVPISNLHLLLSILVTLPIFYLFFRKVISGAGGG
jgi:hypothetical protein